MTAIEIFKMLKDDDLDGLISEIGIVEISEYIDHTDDCPQTITDILAFLWLGDTSTRGRHYFWQQITDAFKSSWNPSALRSLSQQAAFGKMYGYGYEPDIRRTIKPLTAKQINFARRLLPQRALIIWAVFKIAQHMLAEDGKAKAQQILKGE